MMKAIELEEFDRNRSRKQPSRNEIPKREREVEEEEKEETDERKDGQTAD